jgi:ATP-dependent DNA helicase RecQ
MVRYADARTCRHRFILDYFGDTSEHPGCTTCDNCRGKSRPEARLPNEEETVILQKALSCVARMKGRYGRGRVTQVLTGSSAKDIVASGLDKLSTYGLLADEGTDYVWSLLDALAEAGCIETSKDEFRTLSLAPPGDDVMRRKTSLSLHLPERRVKKTATVTHREISSDDDAAYDSHVFSALKQWRREKADEMGGVPAFLIFSDRTLRDLARATPADIAALQRVRGIGPAKLAKYGTETIAAIAKARSGS